MFDISFSELLVIAVVALLVIGPEKLPKVARTLGVLTGRMQRYIHQVKTDIQQEMQLEDLKLMQQELQQRAIQAEASILNPKNVTPAPPALKKRSRKPKH